MSTIKILWYASDKLMQEELIATGEKPGQARHFELDLTELTPEQRRALAITPSTTTLHLTSLSKYNPDRHDFLLHEQLHFDAQPTLQQIIEVIAQTSEAEQRASESQDARLRERARIVEENAAMLREAKSRVDELEAAGDLEGLRQFPHAEFRFNDSINDRSWAILSDYHAAAQARIAADRFTDEMDNWIIEHGSDHLRKCRTEGYECTRLYVEERAAQEVPDYTVDFYDEAGWKDRTNPAMRELELLDEQKARFPDHRVRLVWLTEPARYQPDDEDYLIAREMFDPQPAVVVRGYLEKYVLVKIPL